MRGARRRGRVGVRDALLVAALATERLLELLHSRRNLARAGAAGAGEPAAPRSYPLMVVLHLALFTLPLARRWRRPRPPAVGRFAAAGVRAAATGLRVWSIASLGTAWNVEARVPVDLVPIRRGPYRYCRHPNYVAVAAEFLALPAYLGAAREALWLSLLDGAVLWARIRGEERRLGANPAYRSAFADTPRFIPRRGPRRAPAPPPPPPPTIAARAGWPGPG